MWGSQGPLSEAGNFIRSIFPLSVTGALRDTTVSSAGRAYIQITFLPLSHVANNGTLTPYQWTGPQCPGLSSWPPGLFSSVLYPACVPPGSESALPRCHLADSPAPALPHPVALMQPKLTSNGRPEGLRKLVTD